MIDDVSRSESNVCCHEKLQRMSNLLTPKPTIISACQRAASMFAAAVLVVAVSGCAQFSAPPSLGDWMRGKNKPLTPDESDIYTPPSVDGNVDRLRESAINLDGSLPPASNVEQVSHIAQQSGRHVARQYPTGPAVSGPPAYPGAPGTQANPQPGNAAFAPPGIVSGNPNLTRPVMRSNPHIGNTIVTPPAPTTVTPGNAAAVQMGQNQVPSIAQAPSMAPSMPAPMTLPPNNTNPGFTQPSMQPAPSQPLPSQPSPMASQSIQPPIVSGNAGGGFTRPTFVPGSGTDFPPIGTDPVYTPTLRQADLIINGFPARTGRIMLGGAVNSDAGVTGQITVDERNFDITRWPASFRRLFTGEPALRGAGETFRLEAAPGSDFDRYTVQWATPNLFNYLPFSFSISGFLFDRRFNDWDEQRLGGRMSFGYRVTPDLSVSLGISGQEVEISNPRSLSVQQLNDVVGENEFYTGSVSLKHDTRNSPIQASAGHYFDFTFEKAFGDFDYSRFELEFRQYWLLTQRIDGSGKQTVSYSTQLGFSGDETPIFENFFAGGYATIRGFDFRGAGPVVSGIEVGGRFQWLNSVEYMFPITADDAFRGVAFVDFGTVEQDIELDPDNFRVAPGVGLRVAIPALGPAPLAFDFAFPVAKAATDEERIFSFYMSLIR